VEEPIKPSPPFLSEFEWDALVQGISDQQCILFVGPECYSLATDTTQAASLSAYLKEHQATLNIRVQENGWFHLQKGGSDGPAYSAIRRFYKNAAPDSTALLAQIAKIPFHLLLSLTPDYHLRTAFEQQNFPHRFEAYIRNEPNRDTQAPTKALPLIFNVMGELQQRNSLILTYNDFYDYIESTFTGNSMSTLLTNNIMDAQYFLFLGIPFDQWFVQLFMRILRQHREKEGKTKFAPLANGINADVFSEQYNIKFINTNIPAFVQELYKQCKAEGILKQSIQTAPQGAAVNHVFFQEKDILIKIIQLSSRHNSLREQINLGIIKSDDELTEMNKIRKAYLETIQDLETIWEQLNIQL